MRVGRRRHKDKAIEDNCLHAMAWRAWTVYVLLIAYLFQYRRCVSCLFLPPRYCYYYGAIIQLSPPHLSPPKKCTNSCIRGVANPVRGFLPWAGNDDGENLRRLNEPKTKETTKNTRPLKSNHGTIMRRKLKELGASRKYCIIGFVLFLPQRKALEREEVKFSH